MNMLAPDRRTLRAALAAAAMLIPVVIAPAASAAVVSYEGRCARTIDVVQWAPQKGAVARFIADKFESSGETGLWIGLGRTRTTFWSAEGGDPEMAKKAAAFVKQIDRLPLPVNSAPGFLVNAVLGPYMLEALRAVDEGNSPETVDEAMLAFGMPMGPIELVDMVGLDVAMAAGKALAGSGAEPPKCLVERFNAGNLGKKTGKGFYDHSSGKPAKGAPGSVPAGLAARLVKPLLDKTQKLVDEGIVADADLADAGVIFGTGFAPFTGGPLNYAKNLNG